MSRTKVECPHCGAIYQSYGWAEHVRCESCHKMFEVDIADTTEGNMERFVERINGLWDGDKKDGKNVDGDDEDETR